MNETITAGPSFPEALRRALAPVGAAEPGLLHGDGTYARIREALREDDSSLPQGIWTRDRKRADPERAAELALDALETRAKDAYVAGWLIQAWVRQHGFSGVQQGLWLLVRLCERYWDVLQPLADGDDTDARDRAFEYLAQDLSLRVRLLPLTQAGDGPGFSWHDWQAARRRESHGVRDDGPLPDEIRQAAALTPDGFYAGVTRELAGGIQALDALQAMYEAGRAPAFPPLRMLLEHIRVWTRAQLPERWEEAKDDERAADAADASGREDGDGCAGDAAAGHHGGDGGAAAETVRLTVALPARVGSRAEAYRLLEAAADYLARTEPHSPVPPLVRRAVAWGRLDLAGLVAEMSREGYDLQCLRTLLGLAGEERR
ncbi:MAG TPA: type VI secretion system protein TssA [Longimicrobium sp.]|nr:type VI secretion system protein TssA [Longimicrobium sp.]